MNPSILALTPITVIKHLSFLADDKKKNIDAFGGSIQAKPLKRDSISALRVDHSPKWVSVAPGDGYSQKWTRLQNRQASDLNRVPTHGTSLYCNLSCHFTSEPLGNCSGTYEYDISMLRQQLGLDYEVLT